MFLGHFGVALAAKKAAPDVSLATGFLAAQFADTLWPILVLAGVERVSIVPGHTVVTPLRFDHYPYSHSLLLLVVWGAAFAAVHFASRRRLRAALVLGLLVASHWVLDWVSHVPDLPLTPWTAQRLGLGLWDSRPATLAAEGLVFLGGLWLALGGTRARDAWGRFGLFGLLAFLVVVYGASVFGPPPPSVAALAWTSVAAPLILLPWVASVERHRTPR